MKIPDAKQKLPNSLEDEYLGRIMGTQILGPVILPDILNSETYLEFLRDNLPDFLEEIPLFERSKIVFQQDGAGPHNARIVTDYLNQQFPRR